MHGAALAINWILGVRFAGSALRSEREREVATRAAAGDAELAGVDAILRRMMADETHGAVHVLRDLRNDEARLRSVDDGEDGVAAIQVGREVAGLDRVVAGEPAAAHHGDDASAVGLGRLEHIQRERRAELARVDDVFGAGDLRLFLGAAGRSEEQRECDERGEENLFHRHCCAGTGGKLGSEAGFSQGSMTNDQGRGRLRREGKIGKAAGER